MPDEPCQVDPRTTWSEPERWVWAQVCAGKVADLNDHLGKGLDPRSAAGWTEERKLSSAFLETILLHDPWRPAISRRGVRIVGASFDEDLDLEGADLGHELWLVRSRFASDIDLRRIRTRFPLSLAGSVIAGTLDLDSADIGGSLLVSAGARLTELFLRSAQIGGQLSLTGAKIIGRLDMDSIRIGGSLFMRQGAEFGDVNLRGARIGGQVSLTGARVTRRLDMDSASIGGAVLMRGNAQFAEAILRNVNVGGRLEVARARITGPFDLGSATIGGALFMFDSSFSKNINLIFAKIGDNLDLRGATLAGVDLTGARVQGELRLASGTWLPIWLPEARLVLRNARVDVLQDEPEAWPAHVHLDGFSYERIGGFGGDRRAAIGRRGSQ